MSHAFLINVHNDADQAVRQVRLLRKWFPASRVHVYYDGPGKAGHGSQLTFFKEMADRLHMAPCQPKKCLGIIEAFNYLVEEAYCDGAELATILHADMIPTNRLTFNSFLGHFRLSAKLVTWTTMWPGHPCIDFCSLNLRPDLAIQAKLFPVEYRPDPPEETWNELQFTRSWDRHCPRWRSLAYKVWTIVSPYTGEYRTEDGPVTKWGHTPGLAFSIHNFTPETSVIHTNSPVFWDHFDELVR